MTVPFDTLRTSTSGVAPDTITVSDTAPSLSSTLTVATKLDVSSSPSRRRVVNPGRVNVTA
ncbi:hypothetical protein D3C83_194590 [compost metagenome]